MKAGGRFKKSPVSSRFHDNLLFSASLLHIVRYDHWTYKCWTITVFGRHFTNFIFLCYQSLNFILLPASFHSFHPFTLYLIRCASLSPSFFLYSNTKDKLGCLFICWFVDFGCHCFLDDYAGHLKTHTWDTHLCYRCRLEHLLIFPLLYSIRLCAESPPAGCKFIDSF